MANKSFKISGQLDVSNIIANTEKLKNALKSSLDTASFQKIEKEFEKLAQAQAVYQKAMQNSFSNQSDIKTANKAIENFVKTYSKLSTAIQATLDTKGVIIPENISKELEKERKEIEAEEKRIANAAKNWKTQIQNTLASSSLPKGKQQSLARSIFSEEEFRNQINKIKQESEKEFSRMYEEIKRKQEDLISERRKISQYTDEQKRQTFLTPSQQAQYDNLKTKKSSKTSVLKEQFNDLKKLRKKYKSTQKSYEKRIEEIKRLESEVQQAKIRLADSSQTEALYRQQNQSATARNDAELKRLTNQTRADKATLRKAQINLNEYAQGDTVKSLEANREKSKQNINNLENDIKTLKNEIKNINKETEELEKIIETNATKSFNATTEKIVFLGKELSETEKKNSLQLEELKNIEKIYDNAPSTEEDTKKLQERKQKLDEQSDSARKAAVQESNLKEILEKTNVAIKESTEESKRNVEQNREIIESQNRVNEAFDNMKNSVKTFLSIGSAITGVRRVLKDTFNDIKDLDKNFAEIAMVTDYSVNQMWNSYDRYAKMANELGQSTRSVIQASGLFYQQGLDTAESLALTEDTMKLATLAGLDFKEATSQMTSALRGFNLEMDEGARVTDVYSELAAKAAADVQGIAYAMSKTASIAASAGMEFETTSAFLTQMIETTQEAPENIGTAMKTIIARFTELKENVAGTEDSEFEDLDYNKVDIALKSVGVSLKDTNGQFRDLDDVFLELSEKWDGLSRNSQRYIATIAAGSRQQSRFIAMMENYDRTIELVNTAYTSAGRASEQFAKYQDTVEYKLNRISNSWEQLRTNIFDSDTYKKALDVINSLMNTINNMNLSQVLSTGIIGITLGKTFILNLIAGIRASSDNIAEEVNKIKLKIDKKFSKNPLKIRYDNSSIENIKSELIQLGIETENIDSKTGSLIIEYIKLRTEIDKITMELQDQGLESEEINNKLREQYDLERKITSELKKRGIKYEEINGIINGDNGAKIRGTAGASKKKVSIGGQIASDAITGAITTGLITAFSTGDFKKALSASLIGGITSAIPLVIGQIVPKIIASLNPVTGAIAAVGTIALITGKMINDHKKKVEKLQLDIQKAELNRLKKVEEANRKLEKQQNNAVKQLDVTRKEIKTVDDLQKRYEELSDKSFLTTNETTELETIVESLTTNYDDLILSFDENTNEIIFNTSAIKELTETLRSDEERYQGEIGVSGMAQVFNRAAAQSKSKELATEIAEDFKNYGISEVTVKRGWVKNETTSSIVDKEIANTVVSASNAFAGGGTEKQKLTIEKLNQLSPEVKAMAGLDPDMVYTPENFNAWWFAEDREKEINSSLDKFAENLIKASEAAYDTTKDQQELQKEISDSLKTQYISYEVDGEKIPENIAKDLAVSDITEEDLLKYNVTLPVSATGIIDAIEKKEWSKIANITGIQNDPETLFKFLGFVDENGEINIPKKIFNTSSTFQEGLNDLQAETFKNIITSINPNLDTIDTSTEAGRELIKKYIAQALLIADASLSLSENMSISEEDLNEKYKEEYNEYLKLQEDAINLTYNEYNNRLNKIIESEDNAFTKAVKQAHETLTNEFEANQKKFGETFKNWGLDNKNFSYKVSDSIIEQAQKSNLDDPQKQQEFAQALVNEYNKISSGAQTVLSDIDFSDGYSQILMSSHDYIQKIAEQGGYTLDKAKEIFDDYIDIGMKYYSQPLENVESIKILENQYAQFFQDTQEKFKLLNDAQKEYFENNGKLSEETARSLQNNGFSQYVIETSKGYELLTDAAEDAYLAQLRIPEESLKAQMEMTQEELNKKLDNETRKLNSLKMGKKLGFLNISDEEIREQENIVNSLIQELKKLTPAYNEALRSFQIQSIVSLSTALMSAKESTEDLKEELEDLQKQLTEDQEALNEAAQALHEAQYGTEDFQGKLDGLINYERPLSLINKQLENLKENLTNISDIEDAKYALGQITSLYENKIATLSAENRTINQSLSNIRNELISNYGNYISFDENGVALIDFSYLDMNNSDIIKTEGFESLYEQYNSYYDMVLDKEKEIANVQNEFNELKSEARNKYINMEQNVIDIIKEQMQEEIDAVTDKYAALEEADNNYLDALQEAIDKQRQLRDQENKYEDLAAKERKLSLMQRDTSGANRKEILNIEREIEEDRENLLDNEIDNLIDSMKDLYDKQKEARDLEIEAMEAATENMQLINETALNIISGFTIAEDYQSWLLSNNPAIKDMTIAQTDQYLEEAKEIFSGYAQYAALTSEEIGLKTEEILKKENEIFENTSENISNLGTVIQDLAEKNSQKAIEEAQKAYQDTIDRMNETQEKINEVSNKFNKAEDDAILKHEAAMNELIRLSEEGVKDAAILAISTMAELEGYDLTKKEDIENFGKKYGYISDNGYVTNNFMGAINNAGGTIGQESGTGKYLIDSNKPGIVWPDKTITYFNTKNDLEKHLQSYQELKPQNAFDDMKKRWIMNGEYKVFKDGGYVDYTGPAWVDGTPQKPESFLNSEDTARIGAAAKLLENLPIFNKTSNAENAVSTNIGDTSIEIHINIESISDDYDVDQMIERVKQDIVDVAKPIGTSVILNK